MPTSLPHPRGVRQDSGAGRTVIHGGTPTEAGYSLSAWFAIVVLIVALVAAALLSRHSTHASASLIQTIESLSE